MPEAVVIDSTGAEPTVEYTHRGEDPTDRPSLEELLDEIDTILSVEA